MGILKEMFDEDNNGDFNKREPVFLAEVNYKNEKKEVIDGYKLFQKKYVYKSFFWKIPLVLLAAASSVLMLMDKNNANYALSAMCLLGSIGVGIYFVSEPINRRKNVIRGLEEVGEAEYHAVITDMTIKISTNDMPAEVDDDELNSEDTDKVNDDGVNAEENDDADEIPATLIHLDSPIVEILDTDEMFIVSVKKSYVFIIPKNVFSEDTAQNTRERLAAVMGIRYKLL